MKYKGIDRNINSVILSAMEAILTIGVSASGKSTWARDFVSKNPGWVIVCRDDVRTEMLGGKLDWSRWNWRREDEVTRTCERLILEAKKNRLNLIIADTNLPSVKNGVVNNHLRVKLVNKLEMLGYNVTLKEFDISLDEAIKRDYNRDCSVGESVIRQQYEKWLAYKNG